jgi:hypothetical protein
MLVDHRRRLLNLAGDAPDGRGGDTLPLQYLQNDCDETVDTAM